MKRTRIKSKMKINKVKPKEKIKLLKNRRLQMYFIINLALNKVRTSGGNSIS